MDVWRVVLRCPVSGRPVNSGERVLTAPGDAPDTANGRPVPRTIAECPHCGRGHRVPAGEVLYVRVERSGPEPAPEPEPRPGGMLGDSA